MHSEQKKWSPPEIDAAELAERLRFIQWAQEDQVRLNGWQNSAEALIDNAVLKLYDHLEQFAVPAGILRDEATVTRLKGRQREYYQELFRGRIDGDYLKDRSLIGHVHEQLGVDLRWYLGSYRLCLGEMLEGMVSVDGVDSRWALESFQSLLKIVFFDISLSAEAYLAATTRALAASESRFSHALRGANDGIWEWELEADTLYVSDWWAGMLGFSAAAIGQQSAGWFDLVHGDDLDGLRLAIDTHLEGGTPSLYCEYRIRTAMDGFRWVLVRGVVESDQQGRRRLAGSQTDISRQRHNQKQLEHAAKHDQLTGLLNRRRFNSYLEDILLRQGRSGVRYAALLFIDLDRFKLINDSLGHAAGDKVLRHVAKRLQDCVRTGDRLARFGGDEFVVLLDDLAVPQDAEVIARKILISLREPLRFGDRYLVVSASIGITLLGPEQSPEQALQAADLALYRAKETGKARYHLFDQSMQDEVRSRLRLETDALQALQRNEFSMVYQPVIDLSSPEGCPPVAVESLLRWCHDGEPVSPVSFIPVLEESGEIIPVGYWVLEQACQQTVYWQNNGAPHLRCSVNLSGLQLREADFSHRVRGILDRTGLPSTSLVLEITESLLVDAEGHSVSSLRELAAMGVRIALDDFGTGFCSLGYLNRFPIHIIKLDRSFLVEAHHNPTQQAICRAIISLSATLGLDVVAEGIETREQVDFLLAESCRFGQGFLLSHPLSVADMNLMLSR